MSELQLFEVREAPIDVAELAASVAGSREGTFVSLEERAGDGCEPMAGQSVTEGNAIVRDALRGVLAARCVLRAGPVFAGDVTAWVGVLAADSDAALRACRHILDEVKRRVLPGRKGFPDLSGESRGPAQAVPALGSLVLAGGVSSRMGLDKARLVYDGEPQVRRIARLLEGVAGPTFVSVRPAQVTDKVFNGLRLLPDTEGGIGPLEGIIRAFREDPRRAWLVVAVDMPFLTEPVLRRLVESRDPSRYATAYRIPEIDGPEPVCAIYEPRILPVLEERKAQRRYSLMLLKDVPIKLVDATDPLELRNINNLEEYREAGGPAAGG